MFFTTPFTSAPATSLPPQGNSRPRSRDVAPSPSFHRPPSSRELPTASTPAAVERVPEVGQHDKPGLSPVRPREPTMDANKEICPIIGRVRGRERPLNPLEGAFCPLEQGSEYFVLENFRTFDPKSVDKRMEWRQTSLSRRETPRRRSWESLHFAGMAGGRGARRRTRHVALAESGDLRKIRLG